MYVFIRVISLLKHLYLQTIALKRTKYQENMSKVNDWVTAIDPTTYGKEFVRPHSSVTTLVLPESLDTTNAQNTMKLIFPLDHQTKRKAG